MSFCIHSEPQKLSGNEPGPSDLEIMKYIPPDRIRPLVDTAAIDMAVIVVTTLQRVIIASPSTSPA